MSILEDLIFAFMDEVVMSNPKLRKKTNEILSGYTDKKNRMITNYERAQERAAYMSDEEVRRAIKCTNDNATKSGYVNVLNNRQSTKITR